MSVWERLLPVQELDSTLDQLRHRLATLPARSELAAVTEELVALRRDREAAAAERHALDRQQQRIEDEIASVRAKKERDEDQLYGGASSDAKQLRSLQDEIAALDRRIDALETDELEIMEQLDPVQERLAELDVRQETLDQRAMQLTAEIAESEADIGDRLESTRADRDAAVAAVGDADAIASYERARTGLGGVAVARLESGICGGCHIGLSAMERDRIKHLPADEPVRCEECGRFLVRS